MNGLTTPDAQTLRNLLGSTNSASSDRGGFYNAYRNLIKGAPGGGAGQVLIQAQITTYSGYWGGAAIISNSHAQIFGGDNYNISLDEFSWIIDRIGGQYT